MAAGSSLAKRAAVKALTLMTGRWNHRSAQWYEAISASGSVQRTFSQLYEEVESDRASGGLWQSASDGWFQGDDALFEAFVAHVRERQCLEIGSGPYGYLAPCAWIRNRVVIDPLIDRYRSFQLKTLGKTFWTPDIRTYATPAETVIAALRGAVDGAIVCQNALDHAEDPLAILDAISEYAAPGCYFLFWTDIWHLRGTDIGHRNITRSAAVMAKLVDGLGFEIIKPGTTVRPADETIEFGCLARKR